MQLVALHNQNILSHLAKYRISKMTKAWTEKQISCHTYKDTVGSWKDTRILEDVLIPSEHH